MLNSTSHPETQPVMGDANSILFQSTYQVGFDKDIRAQGR